MATSKSNWITIKRGIRGVGNGSTETIIVAGEVIRMKPDKKTKKRTT